MRILNFGSLNIDYVYGVDLGKIDGNKFISNTTQEEDIANLSKGELKPLKIPQDLVYQPTQSTKLDVALNLNAAKSSAALSDYLIKPDGTLDELRLDALDLDALFGADKNPVDAGGHKLLRRSPVFLLHQVTDRHSGKEEQVQDRNAFQPDHEIDTETDEEHERYIPHVRVDGPDNARKINHYIKSYATSKSQSEPR